MKTIVLLISLSLSSVAFGQSITCRQKGDAFVPVTASGAEITPFGYTEKALCESATAKSRAGTLVCAWNGRTYSIYDAISAKRYGSLEDQAGFSTIEMCAEATQLQAKPSVAVCSWNGHYYIPYSRKDNTPLSSVTSGWDNMKACVAQTVETASGGAICGWTSRSQLFALDGKSLPFSFKSNDECPPFMRLFSKAPLFTAMLTKIKAQATLDVLPTAITNGIPNSKVGFAKWKACEVATDMYHLTKNTGGLLNRECSPDTLYSWGGFDKLEWFKQNLGDGAKWSATLPRGLFTTPSAAGTFGYGAVPMRFKIKPNVVFQRVDDYHGTCDTADMMAGHTIQDTIFQRVVNRAGGSQSFVDWIICSPQVIESWSFATREHFDEILRDYKWMTTENYFNWEAYSKSNGIDAFMNNAIDGGYDKNPTVFTQTAFNVHMNVLKALAVSEAGKIQTQAGGAATKVTHFTTRWPVYFNPN